MFKVKGFILLFCFPSVLLFSQLKKGDQFVSKSQYIKAISKYKKAIGGNSSFNQEAHIPTAFMQGSRL